jgi:clan AA aspartic protease (TIGR02281 family)
MKRHLLAAAILAGLTGQAMAGLFSQTPIERACSDQADARGLHGLARKQFRAACKEQGALTAPGAPAAAPVAPVIAGTGQIRIPLKNDGGTFVVPVQINGTVTLDFIVDSGAADVTLPADVVSTLARTGSIRSADVTGKQINVTADGSKSQSITFTIRSLKIANTVMVQNVTGTVTAAAGGPLLGQTFLQRFKSWSIDNTRHELVLETR